MTWTMRILVVATMWVAASSASADFIATFEAPDYNGSAAGTVLTGHQGRYVPVGIDAHVYTYAASMLGLTATNTTGVAQFGAGLRAADYPRAQHDYNFVSNPVVKIAYDTSCSFFGGGTAPTSGWCGSISLQPSDASQSILSMRQWTTGIPPAYEIVYGVHTNPAAPTTRYWTPVIFGNLPTNHWFRDEIIIDSGAHRVVEIALRRSTFQTFLMSSRHFFDGIRGGWYSDASITSTSAVSGAAGSASRWARSSLALLLYHP